MLAALLEGCGEPEQRCFVRTGGGDHAADPIKSSTAEAIAALHQDGIRIVMLTGDSKTTAEAVAKKLGIDSVEAEVLPDQKAARVKALQAEGRIIAMAGDAINDAPALAQAQVGIAMGTGTDVAIESASVTLVKGDLRGTPEKSASAFSANDELHYDLAPRAAHLRRWGVTLNVPSPVDFPRHPAAHVGKLHTGHRSRKDCACRTRSARAFACAGDDDCAQR